ncbi:unnamed protein product [Protopolystoma xenopodis]|uniref:Uncharacterized protein n=1 Tax=Protopolystoma xenopodis TaxID=117903 RepID=A0A3S5A4G6_9PLAT|nr:unnamed protein product [Protopolystoma xenopodis]
MIFGGLTVGRIICQRLTPVALSEIDYFEKLKSRVIECHRNPEFRVRIAAGDLMGIMCSKTGEHLFRYFLPSVKKGISENLERSSECQIGPPSDLPKEIKEKISILHDTAGWKHLETWMKCLQSLIAGLGPERFKQIQDPELLDIIFKAVAHTNRFVRETGYDLLQIHTENLGYHGSNKNCVSKGESDFIRISKQISAGLSDNWSQVRMAASRAARMFFSVPPPSGFSFTDVYPILLPPICLNRYYIAEGVRLYSQETWKLVTNGKGKQLLESCLEQALNFYILQSDADNHAVREAACASIAEAGCKLNRELLRPHISCLLEALIVCFGDDSWPVRDAACVASGNLVAAFVRDVRTLLDLEGHADLFMIHFLHNLSDSIPSVRLGAAQAIAQIISSTLKEDEESDADVESKAANQLLRQRYLDFVSTSLEKVSEQPAESHGAASERLDGIGPGSSPGLRRVTVDPHDSRHTDQVMYSCGSLAPKLHKAGNMVRFTGLVEDGIDHRRQNLVCFTRSRSPGACYDEGAKPTSHLKNTGRTLKSYHLDHSIYRTHHGLPANFRLRAGTSEQNAN